MILYTAKQLDVNWQTDFGLGYELFTTRNAAIINAYINHIPTDSIYEIELDISNVRILDLLDGTHTFIEWSGLSIPNRSFYSRYALENANHEFVINNAKEINISNYDIIVAPKMQAFACYTMTSILNNSKDMALLQFMLDNHSYDECVTILSENVLQHIVSIKEIKMENLSTIISEANQVEILNIEATKNIRSKPSSIFSESIRNVARGKYPIDADFLKLYRV